MIENSWKVMIAESDPGNARFAKSLIDSSNRGLQGVEYLYLNHLLTMVIIPERLQEYVAGLFGPAFSEEEVFKLYQERKAASNLSIALFKVAEWSKPELDRIIENIALPNNKKNRSSKKSTCLWVI